MSPLKVRLSKTYNNVYKYLLVCTKYTLEEIDSPKRRCKATNEN